MSSIITSAKLFSCCKQCDQMKQVLLVCILLLVYIKDIHSISWLKSKCSSDHCGHMCFRRLAHQFKYQATSTQAFQINDFYSNPGDEENENKMIWLKV